MKRTPRWLVQLATGGVMLGVIQAAGAVNFATVITNFLTTILSVLVTLLLGGNLNQFLLGGTTGGSLFG